jgi:hypothetical protein
MGDLLGDLIDGLRQLDVNLTVEELCDALWLAARDWTDFPTAFSAADHAGPERSGAEGGGAAPHGQRPPRGHGTWSEQAIIVPRELGASPAKAEADVPSLPSMPISLPDAPALPQARQLAAILRPLRNDPRKTSPQATLDEEATALQTAQMGSRHLVWQSTRRRRIDLDFVFDIGGSGPLWIRLATELNAMLETVGVFRSARFWVLNSDEDGLPLLPAAPGSAPSRGASVPYQAVCAAPRRPVVVLLTDCTGKAWQNGDGHEPLRIWARRGTMVAVQLLPPRMWNRTAVRPLPVGFRAANGSEHSGARVEIDDAALFSAGLDRSQLPAATAIPVIGLDAQWLRAWLPLALGVEAGTVPGYAALIPSAEKRVQPDAPSEATKAEAEPPQPEDRYDQFMFMASRDARELARLLAVTSPTLPGMRKIRYQLLPGSRPEILAEVLLGGLMHWPPVTAAEAMAGTLPIAFHDGVQDLLRERPGGVAELKRDKHLVDVALQASYGADRTYEALAVGPGLVGPAVSVGRGTSRTATGLVAPYPPPSVVAAPYRVHAFEDAAAPGEGDVPVATSKDGIRIGIWGSNSSGRSTYLAVLGKPDETGWTDETGWNYWRRGEQWRVMPANETTKDFVKLRIDRFEREREFPRETLRHQPESLSFRLERRRAHSLRNWFRAEPVAEISISLEDTAGFDFLGSSESLARVAGDLADSQILLYFYDPVYDSEPNKYHSADFFNKIAVEVARLMRKRLHQGFPPQQLAVCIPKLDDQDVFDKARRYGCTWTDKRSGMPWVPPPFAKRLFESITYDENSIAAHQLREIVSHSFHPGRTSFHAFSSIGFWDGPNGGVFDPKDVCNTKKVPVSEVRTRPELRGGIRPVHIIDPLITLVERHIRQAGRS